MFFPTDVAHIGRDNYHGHEWWNACDELHSNGQIEAMQQSLAKNGHFWIK